MADRPGLGRDDSYNRVFLPGDLKSSILSMINDSSESLPMSTVTESDDDPHARANRDSKALAQPATYDTNQLSEPISAADTANSKLEQADPLAQIPTVREPSPSTSPSDKASVDPVLATPSPVRSHELLGTGSLRSKMPGIIKRTVTQDGADENEKGILGQTASRASTSSQTISGKKEKGRPGLAKRMSTAIKRTVSRAHEREDK